MTLAIDVGLLAAWRSVAPAEVAVHGLAGHVIDGRAAVIAATVTPLTGVLIDDVTSALATVLDARGVEIVVVTGTTVPEVIGQWVHQAAQGSGRGVRVRVIEDQSSVRVLVDAIDSSARELTLRLRSPHDPALPALCALLGGREVTVEDADGS